MDTKYSIIAKNASILLVTDIVSKALRTVLAIMIARKLGAADLGLLAYAIAFSEIFSFIPNFGLKVFINREVAKYPEKSGKYFSNLSIAKLGFSGITLVVIFLASHILKMEPEKIRLVSIAASIMVLDSFILFYNSFFRGFQKAQFEAILLISENFLVAITGIVIIGLGYGLLPMMIVRFFVTLTIFIVGFILLKIKILLPPFSFDKTFIIEKLKSASPFTILSILIIINTQIGIVLLTNLKGTLITGYYTAALKLCGIFQFLPASVAGAILPAMTKYAKEKNHHDLENTFRRSVKFLLIVMLPIAAGTTIIADKIIHLVYGVDFVPSIMTLRILIWIVVFSFTNTIFNVAFLSIDKEKKFVQIQILSTILNISLCFILIPIFAQNGVAFASFFSQFVTFLISDIYITRYFKDVRITSILFKPILSVLIMVLGLLLIRMLPLIFILLISCTIYCASLVALKIFDQSEMNFLKSGALKISGTLLRK